MENESLLAKIWRILKGFILVIGIPTVWICSILDGFKDLNPFIIFPFLCVCAIVIWFILRAIANTHPNKERVWSLYDFRNKFSKVTISKFNYEVKFIHFSGRLLHKDVTIDIASFRYLNLSDILIDSKNLEIVQSTTGIYSMRWKMK